MGRTLEAIFRRPIKLLTLIILLPLVSLAVAYFAVPRTYGTTASLWALRRYEIIGATGPESDLYATPAETQATALTELLQTRAFALPVAKATQLASTLKSDPNVPEDPQLLDEALFNEISHNVLVVPQGYNLFVVSYINRNPRVAQQVVQAVIANYAAQSQGLTITEAQQLLANYQPQLVKAKNDAAAAAAAETQYLLAHPDLKREVVITDPQYALLHAETLQAQDTLQGIQTHIASINDQLTAQGTSSDSLFRVVDAPVVASRSASRIKQFLIAGGIGLGVAIIACAVCIVILVRRDRAVYSPLDLQKVTTLPVIMQLPHLGSSIVPLLVQGP